jgi:RNA polymerase sigma-70 factor (ECF subfamily)
VDIPVTAINRPGPEEDAQPGIGGDLAARLRLVARGDADAFDAVYDLLAPSVFGIVRRAVRDPAQLRPIAGNHCGDAALD